MPEVWRTCIRNQLFKFNVAPPGGDAVNVE